MKANILIHANFRLLFLLIFNVGIKTCILIIINNKHKPEYKICQSPDET